MFQTFCEAFLMAAVYNCGFVLLAQWYTKPAFVTWLNSFQINLSLRLLVLCLFRPDLIVTHYRLFLFSKNSFLSLAPLTNVTPAFSTLWFLHWLYGSLSLHIHGPYIYVYYCSVSTPTDTLILRLSRRWLWKYCGKSRTCCSCSSHNCFSLIAH